MARMGQTLAEQARAHAAQIIQMQGDHQRELRTYIDQERHWKRVEVMEDHLRKRGLMQHLVDPESRVNREIETWMQALKCTRQEAADAILNRVRRPHDDDQPSV